MPQPSTGVDFRTAKKNWTVLLVVLGLFLCLWRSGGVGLFDLDEGLYVGAARQMILSGDYITPRLNSIPPQDPNSLYTPFFEKPILVYWAAAGSMRLLGISEFGARLPVAVATLATAALVVWFASKRHSPRAAWLAGMIFLTAPMTVADARQMTTDALLVFWLTGLLMSYACLAGIGVTANRKFHVWLSLWLCASGAILTKGAVGLLLPSLIIAAYSIFISRASGEKGSNSFTKRLFTSFAVARPVAGLALVVLLCAPWHVAVANRGERDSQGRTFVQEYLVRQHIGRFKGGDKVHNAPFFMHAVYLAVGLFPWVVYLPSALRRKQEASSLEKTSDEIRDGRPSPNSDDPQVKTFLLCWLWAIFLFFSISSAKLPTYTAPIYPAAALLIGVWLDKALKGGRDRALIGGATGATLIGALLMSAAVVGPRYAPKGSPIPAEVISLALHLTSILALTGLTALICFGVRKQVAGVAAFALGMCLLVGMISTEGYATADRLLIAPYQDAAKAAGAAQRSGEPILFLDISPRRPSMLFYVDYSPIEEKDPPFGPIIKRALSKHESFIAVLSRPSFENRIVNELSILHAHAEVLSEKGDGKTGWLAVRISRAHYSRG